MKDEWMILIVKRTSLAIWIFASVSILLLSIFEKKINSYVIVIFFTFNAIYVITIIYSIVKGRYKDKKGGDSE